MITFKTLQPRFLRHKPPLSAMLLGVVILALCLRLVAWYLEPVVSRDGIFYLKLAETLHEVDGNFETLASVQGEYSQSPLFVAILASNLWGASPHVIALAMNMLLGSLFPILIYMIFIQLFEKPRIALTGALFAALHPTLVNYSIEIQREMGYLFFAGCFFYFMICAFKFQRWYWVVYAAIAAVIAFFFRYEGGELFCLAGIIYLAAWLKKRISWKTGLVHGGIFVFCAIFTTMVILMLCSKSPIDWWKNSYHKFSTYFKA